MSPQRETEIFPIFYNYIICQLQSCLKYIEGAPVTSIGRDISE